MKKMNSDYDNQNDLDVPTNDNIDEVLLSLYKKGYVNLDTSQSELKVSVTDAGKQAYLTELFVSMTAPVDA
tara:strand:+ start:86 stop:298 length:213 start_codon:yes stop_codon:yes gene_type:complete